MGDPTAAAIELGGPSGARQAGTRRVADGVALGAHRSLRSGPTGAAGLWRAFLAVHDGDEEAALGQLLLRVLQLESPHQN